jgi:hypothetical protein
LPGTFRFLNITFFKTHRGKRRAEPEIFETREESGGRLADIVDITIKFLPIKAPGAA